MSALPSTAPPAAATVAGLVAAALLVAVPLVRELPNWASAAYFATVLWRLAHHRWGLPQPGRLVRSLLAVAAIVLVYRHYGTVLGREPGVALLVLLTGFKLLELRSMRDTVFAALLLLLILLAAFLFDNSLPLGMYGFIAVIGVTAVLVHIQQPGLTPIAALRTAGRLVALALPLMLVTHFLFPRLPGPLWGTPAADRQATTGMPEDMRPGNITALNLSDAVAFRAYFDEAPPPAAQLYWRVYVFWDSDGRVWRTGSPFRASDNVQGAGPSVSYRLVVEPNDERWLPVLDLPTTVPAALRARPGFIYETRLPRRERQTLDLTSTPRYRTGSIGDLERRRALALPAQLSRRVRALADDWRRSAQRPQDVVRVALDHFRREPFVYTLTPPALGADPVEEFLFETRRGFCEHYAAAFVTLMRAAGIPARVVVGYQGGVYNPSGNYLIVRQADAHAWAEVWTAESGWVRVDPTAAIAPARVEYGIDAVRRLEAQGMPLSTIGGEAVLRAIRLALLEQAWLRTRLTWDYVNLSWSLWVADYSLDRQARLLERFGITHGAMLLVAIVALQLVLLYALFQWRARAPRDVVQRLYDEYCKKLARVGIARHDAEGPVALAKRACSNRPDLAATINGITHLYVALRYGGAHTKTDLPALARAVRVFRPSPLSE